MRRFDIAVIGGGSTGTSLAFHLAKMGQKNVALIEKGDWGSGMTGRSTATVTLHYGNPTLARMALLSLRFFERFHQETGGDPGFVQSGAMVVIDNKERHVLASNIELQRSVGIEARILDGEEVTSVEPEISASDASVFGYYPDGGFASPTDTARSFAEAAGRLGATLISNTTVKGVDGLTAPRKTLRTSAGDLEAETIVNAAGVWANKVSSWFGVGLPLEITKQPVMIFRRPDGFRGIRPFVSDRTRMTYFRSDANSLVDVGNVGHGFGTGYDADSYDERDFRGQQPAYVQDLVHRFPIMAGATLWGGYSALYDVTPDHYPILDRLEAVSGYYCAAGLSGQGFKFAPLLGKGMAELILDGRAKDYDISMFSLDRFERGRLIASLHPYSSTPLQNS